MDPIEAFNPRIRPNSRQCRRRYRYTQLRQFTAAAAILHNCGNSLQLRQFSATATIHRNCDNSQQLRQITATAAFYCNCSSSLPVITRGCRCFRGCKWTTLKWCLRKWCLAEFSAATAGHFPRLSVICRDRWWFPAAATATICCNSGNSPLLQRFTATAVIHRNCGNSPQLRQFTATAAIHRNWGNAAVSGNRAEFWVKC